MLWASARALGTENVYSCVSMVVVDGQQRCRVPIIVWDKDNMLDPRVCTTK